MSFDNWSTTAASNVMATTGVNFDENQSPSTVNDAGRELMAQLKAAVADLTSAQTLTNKTLTSPVINTPTGDVVTLTGTQTLTNKTLTSPTVNDPTITSSAGIQVGSPTGGAKGASTVNTAGLQYVNNKQLSRIVTGTLTATNLGAGSEQTATITHGLVTDDVAIIIHATGATNENWVALGKRSDGTETVIRGTANSSTSMIGPLSAPSSGNVNVSVRNDHGAAQTITVKYMILG